ncbi:hypothetical protein GGQ80_001711 [Sphingomonas jinjuensis]|uniref:Uncharacterized protein n=1 Tax=Sphingomonas jinjuensis TaxID=535907 RepID=A0A840FKF7_9SPHN|nr:hypothetical protein [Sphingomonas jinjuensis]MBB4153805.1 hypothetical protein [Sphingomonas jinjuensis]
MDATTRMTARDRREGRVALAMLPVGTLLTLAAGIGMIAVTALGIDTAIRWPDGAGWMLAWCGLAAVAGWWNLKRSLEVLSAFDWRPVPGIVAVSAAIVALHPGWWLA